MQEICAQICNQHILVSPLMANGGNRDRLNPSFA